jgi:hypothetical protein
MLNAKIFYIFLYLIVIETIGLLLLKKVSKWVILAQKLLSSQFFHLLFTTYVHSLGSALQ